MFRLIVIPHGFLAHEVGAEVFFIAIGEYRCYGGISSHLVLELQGAEEIGTG
jgi:hypothetical protein